MKRRQNIIDCRSLCPYDTTAILLALHVHSGSETTTAFSVTAKRACMQRERVQKKWNAMTRKVNQRIPPDQESHELKIT